MLSSLSVLFWLTCRPTTLHSNFHTFLVHLFILSLNSNSNSHTAYKEFRLIRYVLSLSLSLLLFLVFLLLLFCRRRRMQVSSFCSPFISFNYTPHHFAYPLQFTLHSSPNASVGIIAEPHAHGRLNQLLPVYKPRTTTIRRRRRKYGTGVVSASASSSNGGLEPFTERAIKAIMYSQREAKALGREMVFTQHLLLGLIAEDEEHHLHLHHHYHYEQQGFLGSNITLHMARDAVRNIWTPPPPNSSSSSSISSSSAALPFSISTKRVFGAALHYSRAMAHHFIAPEHISIALFTVDDGSATRLLYRYPSPSFFFSLTKYFRVNCIRPNYTPILNP